MKTHHQLMIEDGCPEFLLREPKEQRVRLKKKMQPVPLPVDPVQAEQAKRLAVFEERDRRKQKKWREQRKLRQATKATFAAGTPKVWNTRRCRWEDA